MKNIIILLFSLFFFSCSTNNPKENVLPSSNEETLYFLEIPLGQPVEDFGKQLVQIYSSFTKKDRTHYEGELYMFSEPSKVSLELFTLGKEHTVEYVCMTLIAVKEKDRNELISGSIEQLGEPIHTREDVYKWKDSLGEHVLGIDLFSPNTGISNISMEWKTQKWLEAHQ